MSLPLWRSACLARAALTRASLVRASLSASLALAFLPLAFLPAPAGATDLTLGEALARAVERSHLSRSARAGAQGAAEMARAAGELPDPMLSAGIDNLPITGRDAGRPWAEDMTMKRIGIAQEWVAANKRAARRDLAEAQARRERLMEPVAAAETRLQTALAYLDAWFAQQAVELARHAQMHAQEEAAVARARLATSAAAMGGNAPGVSSAEVLALQAMQGQAEDELAEVMQQAATARVALQRWVGDGAEVRGGAAKADSVANAANADSAPAGGGDARLPAGHAADPAAFSPEALQLARADLGPLPEEADFVARSAPVQARQRDIEVAQREADLTALARRPNPSFEISYGQRQMRPDLISFSVSLPLPVAPDARQDRETAAKLAMADKARAELAEAERAARAEHAALRSDEQRLAQRLARYPTAVQAPLAQRSAATLAAYQASTASLAMVFEARHAELEAERKLLALQRDLAKARAQLIFKPLAADTIVSPPTAQPAIPTGANGANGPAAGVQP